MSSSGEAGCLLKPPRKDSLSSEVSGSSHQTDQSQSSSVIINKNHAGVSKQISQPMVEGLIEGTNDAFNPNKIFEERNKVGRQDIFADINYVRDQNNEEELGLNFACDEVTNGVSEEPKDVMKGREAIEYGDDGFYDFDALAPEGQSASDDDEITSNQTEYEYDEEEEENFDDGMGFDAEGMPISPPRSPPAELEPDKHYGLCYFSGPDAQHCTLTRNEPVYLLDDHDNYWWLIRKLSREERARSAERTNFSQDEQEPNLEDGKIGFVPAECLETYWERLARLNCFKNEEVERNIKRQNGDVETSPEKEYNVEVPFPAQSTGPSTGKKNSHKAVAFENMGVMISETDDQYEMPLAAEATGFNVLDAECEMIQEENNSVYADDEDSEMPLVIKKSRHKSGNKENPSNEDNVSRNDKVELSRHAAHEGDALSFQNPYKVASEESRRNSSLMYQHANLSLNSVSSASLSYLSGDFQQQPSDFRTDNTTNDSLSFRNSQIFDQLNQDLFDHQNETIKDDFSCTDRSSDLLDHGLDPYLEKSTKAIPPDPAKCNGCEDPINTTGDSISSLQPFSPRGYDSGLVPFEENGMPKFADEKENLKYENSTVLDELDQLVDNLATIKF